VPVITEPLTDLPARFEQLGSTQSNVGRMVDAGVRVAIGGFSASNQPRYAPQQAGNLVALNKLPGATGLTWGEASPRSARSRPRSPGSAAARACSGKARSATSSVGRRSARSQLGAAAGVHRRHRAAARQSPDPPARTLSHAQEGDLPKAYER
jgi:hypothetical protein